MGSGGEVDRDPHLGPEITRRDFVGATLLGSGAVLLGKTCPASAQDLGKSWTGYGGVGDYRFSNGNTAEVVRSAHRIRDGAYDEPLRDVVETGENYDLLIVGAGFTGMTALHEFKKAKPDATALLIDNAPIFGGEAKQNEFDVDGYRLTGPQGSNNTGIYRPFKDGLDHGVFETGVKYWQELQLPTKFEYARLQGDDASIAFQKTNYSAFWHDNPATGYFFQNQLTGPAGRWVKNPSATNFRDVPVADSVKDALVAWRDYKTSMKSSDIWAERPQAAWLDGMSYADLVTRVMGLPSDVLRYAEAYLAANVCGATSDVTSAYAAGLEAMPGTRSGHAGIPGHNSTLDVGLISFPGGNATLLRHFVKAIFPEAIAGSRQFEAIANNPVDFSALDRPASRLKMRLRATAVQVNHEGSPTGSERVSVVYEKGGKLYRVRAKTVILGIGSWVAKHIVKDLPSDYQAAFANVFHGPILVVNVALRNWRFMEKLGISGAGWFDGFGYFANMRRPMVVGDRPIAFHPDKPAVLTFYVPILKAGLPIEAQGPAARAELYATTYANYESQIVAHLRRLFSSAGFNARRDIAGIVLNRWGHAYVTPQPGFFFGKQGEPAPRDIIRRRLGRIAFAHSELGGLQSWWGAATEGKRALQQVLEAL